MDDKRPAGPAQEESSADDAHRERMRALKQRKDEEVKSKEIRRGIVLVHDGDGKGKSTAAFGMAIRALGHGQRVGLVQFIKGTWRTGEKAFFKQLPGLDHVVSGEGFTWETQDRARDRAAAQSGLAAAREMVEASRVDSERGEKPKYDLVILDEVNIALGYGYLDVEDVVRLVRDKPEALSIVLTGRGAKPELIDAADTVTRMECVKHAYQAGIRARRGVDF